MGRGQDAGVIPYHFASLLGNGWAERTLSLLRRRAFFLVGRKCGKEEPNGYHHRLSM